MAHHHENDDDFIHEEKASSFPDLDTVPNGSLLQRSSTDTLSFPQDRYMISMKNIQELAASTQDVTMTIETKSYLHNLVVFLRMNRAVQKGPSPAATTYFEHLSK